MKEFGVSDYDYEHRISIPLRTIMCIDLPRVDYDKDKKMKKTDLEMIKEHNSKIKAGAVATKEQLPSSYLKFVEAKEKHKNNQNLKQ